MHGDRGKPDPLGVLHDAQVDLRSEAGGLPGSPAPPSASPVFVFGVDHSGTTILYRMLAQHPDLTWFSQFSLRRGEIPRRRRRRGAEQFDRWLRILPHDWRKEESRYARFLVPRPGDEGRVWDYLLDDRADVERVRSCLTAFSERHGRKRFLAKRPAFRRSLDKLQAAFPHASFVHAVRDGRPVAFSLRSKQLIRQSKGLPTAAGRELDPDVALRWAAGHWVEGLELVDDTPGIDLLEVRYEDLCEDVHGVLHTILRHARLETESFPFQRCPRTLSNRNAPWIEEASSAELEEVSEIERDLLVRHGYPGVTQPARSGSRSRP